MSGGNGRFKAIMEGDEVERFLAQFVVSDAERARMKAADPAANVDAFPRSLEQVLTDVKALWDDKGFLTPNDLKADLIQKYLPGADPRVTEYITQIENARGAPESTTGYLGKEHAYVATGLAHLYGIETGKPVAMVEADFSNMGGTNDHFRDMLLGEGPVSESTACVMGMHMTDQAVGLLCQSLTSDLADVLPEGAKIVPIRTGGDEIRILVTGVEGREKLQQLTDFLHADVELHVAAMGLQDHRHLKAPDDPARNGFGVALTMQDMREIGDPATLIQELDGDISGSKRALGLARLGQVDDEALRKQFEWRIASGGLTVPAGATADQTIAQKIEETKAQAARAADLLHDMNPSHNPELPSGSTAFVNYIRKATSELHPNPLNAATVPGMLTDPAPIGADRPAGVAPLAPLEDRWNAIAAKHLEDEGVTLNAAERYMLRLSIAGLAAQDPSAQAFMPRIVGPTVEAYAAETVEFRKLWKPEDPDVKSALAAAGLKSVDELTPQALAVSFHNLAGLNNALGHHQADLVLRDMSADIIEKSLRLAGIPQGPPKPYAVAHHGGANFSVMIQPGGIGPDGKPWFAGPAAMERAENEIDSRTHLFNRANIADYLITKGISISDEARTKIPETFGDIEDPKMRDYGGTMVGKVNGLHAQSSAAPMQLRDRGGNEHDGFGFMGRLRRDADARIEARRQSILLINAAWQGVKAGIQITSDKNKPDGDDNDGGENGGLPVTPRKPDTPPKAPITSPAGVKAPAQLTAPADIPPAKPLLADTPVAKEPPPETPAPGTRVTAVLEFAEAGGDLYGRSTGGNTLFAGDFNGSAAPQAEATAKPVVKPNKPRLR